MEHKRLFPTVQSCTHTHTLVCRQKYFQTGEVVKKSTETGSDKEKIKKAILITKKKKDGN